VDREKAYPESADRADALGDRVADVVQLEVEKDFRAGPDQPLGEGKSARIGELIADLVEADRIPEPLHQPFRFIHRGKIQGKDEPVAELYRGRWGLRRVGRGHASDASRKAAQSQT
jgi:hypothetical protein